MKTAVVFLAEGFEEIEAISVIDVLRRAEINTEVVSLSRQLLVTGSRNIAVKADISLDELKEPFDAVILPGGSRGAQNLFESKKLGQIIKSHFKQGKLVAAICAAPAVVLSPLGILTGKKATCYPGMEDLFDKSADYSQEAVIQDKNLITSPGPDKAIAFALEIAQYLAGKDKAEQVAKGLLFNC